MLFSEKSAMIKFIQIHCNVSAPDTVVDPGFGPRAGVGGRRLCQRGLLWGGGVGNY